MIPHSNIAMMTTSCGCAPQPLFASTMPWLLEPLQSGRHRNVRLFSSSWRFLHRLLWRRCGQMLAPPALLASAPSAPVLAADTRPPALLAAAPAAPVPAEARPLSRRADTPLGHRVGGDDEDQQPREVATCSDHSNGLVLIYRTKAGWSRKIALTSP